MAGWGYTFEPYTATTDDDWTLTVFRITGKVGETANASTKPPLFIQHGAMMDAALWINWQTTHNTNGTVDNTQEKPWQLQLVDQGYDVWMGNNRGTRYSNYNPHYPTADNPKSPNYAGENAEKYDFTWFEMGVSDLPAMINKVIEVSGQPKVTYIGYSQGTSQMFYGLTQKEDDYFNDVLNKAILLAPCVYTVSSGFDDYMKIFPKWREAGINVINSENWMFQKANLCGTPGNLEACIYANSMEIDGQQAEPQTVKSFELFNQISIEDRFQVYNPDYTTAADRTMPLV